MQWKNDTFIVRRSWTREGDKTVKYPTYYQFNAYLIITFSEMKMKVKEYTKKIEIIIDHFYNLNMLYFTQYIIWHKDNY